MRKFVIFAGVLLAGVLVGQIVYNGANASGKKKVGARPPYVHAVIFYLKKDAPKNEVQALIADTHKLLAKVPSVRGIWIGRPAKKSTPKFALNDYDVGLLVLFDDYKGLKTYLDHPLHLEYVDRHAKYFDRVPVYDFINQKK